MHGYLPEKQSFASGLSRSLKVTGTDTVLKKTYDFLLMFHSNYTFLSLPFQRRREILAEIAIFFPHPSPYLMPSQKEFLLKLGNTG